jgi:hypothetical protein
LKKDHFILNEKTLIIIFYLSYSYEFDSIKKYIGIYYDINEIYYLVIM